MEFFVKNGVPFGYEGISKTVANGKKATYYVCENRKNMKLHNKYQESIIAK